MEKLNRKEIDAITGEEIVIELTADEIAKREELAKIQEAAYAADDLAKAKAKADLLDRLGITAEEAKLLLA